MTHYQQSIAAATGCGAEDAAAIEEIMRQDVVHSTLDWLSPTQFNQAAKEAAALHATEQAVIEARRAEFQRLAETPDPRKLNTLLAGLQDPRTRLDAALAIAELEDAKVVGSLLRHVDDHRPAVREAVVLALRRCSDVRPAPANATAVALRAVIDPDEGVRMAAAETLSSYLRRNPHPVREALAMAYDDIVRKYGDEPTDTSDDARELRPRPEDLAAYANPELHPPLIAAIQLLEYLKDPRTSSHAADALATRWDERALDDLIAHLTHPHPTVRGSVAEQLWRFPAPHISALVATRAVLDPDLGVRLRAAGALCVHFSIPRYAPQAARIRAGAAIAAVSTALGDIEHRRAIDPVLAAARTPTAHEATPRTPAVIPTPRGIVATHGREK